MDNLMQDIDNLLITENQINEYQPESVGVSIKPPSMFRDELHDEFNTDKQAGMPTLPWQKTFNIFRFRPGEFTEWAGYTGHKKTMTTYQVAIDLACQGQTVCIASMEFKPARSLKRMAIQMIGNHEPPREMRDKFLNFLEGKIFFYDQQNSVNPQEIIKMARYCAEAMGINHLFIDSLMKCGIAPDDFGKQKSMIDEIVAIGKYNGTHNHLVCHMRKAPPATNYIPKGMDIAGGNDITNQADNIFICWTDKQKKAELLKSVANQTEDIINRPCQKLILDKQREEEFEGAIALTWSGKSLTFVESEYYKPFTYWENF